MWVFLHVASGPLTMTKKIAAPVPRSGTCVTGRSTCLIAAEGSTDCSEGTDGDSASEQGLGNSGAVSDSYRSVAFIPGVLFRIDHRVFPSFRQLAT